MVVTALAAFTMASSMLFRVPACGDSVVIHHRGQSLALERTRVHDEHGRVVPVDQALVDTEKGTVAVIGDDAVPIKGKCEERAARRLLSRAF